MIALTYLVRGNREGPLFSTLAAIALGLALAIAPELCFAETRVSGIPDALSIEAQNASVEEILVALSNAFDVHFRSSANLETRLTGTYQGSLQQVVTNVLKGYTFIMKSKEQGIEITLLGSGKAIAVERVKRELDLTPTQVEQMESILDDFAQYYRTVLSDGKSRILHILNPDQQKKFERMLQEQTTSGH